ncbi:hypothetical protein HFU84_08825 [Acidithiobacillus sp. CV18-2]|uniref:Uncharacterized protein n=1 Tax=Igneacidithiobacillus copahuensis TaxID=2724909 RepID=A0AAE2YS40_9PROT|nr:hypothetical protein [Igneacidithiobacillus copahuensis]MBU2753196.1 hypothetical protein [Acidithiobacillus sp. CV18-3]MBU2758506.1 hypothetical protein [Acidithiobacillus sp. BN09-2]MBU2777605.1 hypothetical protein [Acidithiobacillus sp. CV18-2]MBU2797699.1 hypothetical protein [Acidithiobacillus sp. VAN18-2]MBU2798281.1 hypothetical protein [Acidithiobacillus sp. VAN18-4]UTV80690.1 hypothetical protein MQE22_11830 [Acidithiobacillus sp. YTS05]
MTLLRKRSPGVLIVLTALSGGPSALAADPSGKHEQDGFKEFLARPTAPKEILQSKSLQGPKDPYPAADALMRHNVGRWADLDWKGMQAHDNSSAGYGGDEIVDRPIQAKIQQINAKSLMSCRALSQFDMPQGFTLSDDLHDFVINPEALQASLALQGMLFAPESTKHWMILQLSWQLAGHDMPHWDGTQSAEYTKLQTFWRMVPFVATGSVSQLHKAFIQAAAAQGYVFDPPPKVPGWKAGDEFMTFTQQVTPVVMNNAVIVISDPGTDDGDSESAEDRKLMQKLHNTGWRCLVFNDLAKDWLTRVNPKTNLPYQLRDLKLGYILQSSVIPLGKKTEEFTRAHLKERLDKERKMAPAQLAAYRKAEDKRLALDVTKNASTFQKKMLESAEYLDKGAEATKYYEKIYPELRKMGMPEEQIQQMKSQMAEAATIEKQGAKDLREYIHQANTQ